MMRSDMRGDIAEKPDPTEAVPALRWLKALVSALAVAMILGIAAIVTLLWLRLGEAPLPELPASIALPDGARVEAVTFARDWLVVVTDAGEVLLYDRAGKLVSRTAP